MTEAKWLAMADVAKLLEFCSRESGIRKLRLALCGCFRSVWEPR